MFQCPSPALFREFLRRVLGPTGRTTALIFIFPGESLLGLASVLTESFAAYGAHQPDPWFMVAHSITPSLINPVQLIFAFYSDTSFWVFFARRIVPHNLKCFLIVADADTDIALTAISWDHKGRWIIDSNAGAEIFFNTRFCKYYHRVTHPEYS
jgi:hypothetical protein